MAIRKVRPGVVEACKDGKVQVILNKKEMKSICAEKGCSACNHNFPPTEISFKSEAEVTKGDTVFVSTAVLNEALGAFIAFIMPLLIAIFYFVFVTAVFGWGGEEGRTVLSTLAVLVLSLFGLSGVDALIRLFVPPKIISIEKKES